MKKPSYIILLESGERLNINEAIEFNPNEYEWIDRETGFYFEEDDPNESYCYKVDHDERFEDDGVPVTATTQFYRAYDEDGNVVCEEIEHITGFWL